jgi:hypothetical protein
MPPAEKRADPYDGDSKRRELLSKIDALRALIEQPPTEGQELATGELSSVAELEGLTQAEIGDRFANQLRRDWAAAATQNRAGSSLPRLDKTIADYADQSLLVLGGQVDDIRHRLTTYAQSPVGADYDGLLADARSMVAHGYALQNQLHELARDSSTHEAGLHVLDLLNQVLDRLERSKQVALDRIAERDLGTA